MTPLEFYKRFGHETSRQYIGGVFIIHDYYSDWMVDKDQLKQIVDVVDMIDDEGGINEFKLICTEMGEDCLYEFVYDGAPSLLNKVQCIELIKEFESYQ